MSDYINSDELYFSEVHTNGIYAHYDRDSVPSPIPDSLSKSRLVPIVKNILTHELFFCKKVHIASYSQKLILVQEILTPSLNYASWPVDLVSLEEKDVKKDGFEPADLKHFYCDEFHNISEPKPNCALLFPYLKKDISGRGGYAYYTPLDVWLEREPLDQRTYKNDRIKKVCYNIAYTLNKINQSGYLYFDFSLSRFLLKSDLSVVPEYSNLQKNTKEHNKELSAKYGAFPLDFIEPFMYFRYNTEQVDIKDESNRFYFATQNYSLAAMLFYLMFGRKPYEGQRLMQNCDDAKDGVSHYAYLRNYYLKEENIHFIFDNSYKNPNLLVDDYTDMFSADIELWENCPHELCELFIGALQRQSALRKSQTFAPKPGTWVQVFNSLGWGDAK